MLAFTQPAADLRLRPAVGSATADEAFSRTLANAELTVEVRPGELLAGLGHEWADLLNRADVPNVFMAPALLRQAAECGMRVVALLVWQTGADKRRLLGIWGFSIGRAQQSILPIKVLRAPTTEHAYLATPVIDRAHLEPVLTAMLDAIAARSDLPHVLALDAMNDEGATADALKRVLCERQSTHCTLKEAKRPKLVTGSDPASYLEKALSSSTRKKLRQYRRRLAERGDLRSTVAEAPEDIRQAVEAFLRLEAEGWKGRRGTALLNNPRDAAFTRAMLSSFAASGEAFIHALELDGRPVSMQVVLRAGSAAYTWKTAYDESLGDLSPGMLLFEDYTKAFLADGSLAAVDSCAYDETSFMARWCERQKVVDLVIGVRRGPSPLVACAGSVDRSYRAARERAKQLVREARMKAGEFKSRLLRPQTKTA